MSDIADRYRKIAGTFTERVRAVPDDAWDNPAPCEGWVARDVVRHLVEWVPGFIQSYAGIELTPLASVDTDPVAAWTDLDRQVQAVLDDPALAGKELDTPMGRLTLEEALARFCVADVLVHTWDLARATGLDETLDQDEVSGLLEGMEPMDEPMRQSGQFGPRVEVPDDADIQTRLIAFTGRRP